MSIERERPVLCLINAKDNPTVSLSPFPSKSNGPSQTEQRWKDESYSMIDTPHHNMAGSDKDDHVRLPWQQQQQHHPSSAASRIYRVSRASGGKDRHSKVLTAKGLRDRRVRLSVPTALQFYDLQDRLGLDQPSKAVDWLIKAAADAISQLPTLDASSFPRPEAEPSSASGSSKSSALYLSQPKEDKNGSSFTDLLSGGGAGSGSAASTADFFREAALFGQMHKAHHLESGSGENPHKRFSFLQEHLNPPAAAAAGRESGGLNFSMSSSGLIQGLERGPLQSNLASHIHHDHDRHRSDDASNGLIGLNLPFFAAPAAAGAFAGGQLYYTNGYWQHSNSKGEGKG